MMQVEQMMAELSQAWRKLGEQPGGMSCIDMLVRPTLDLAQQRCTTTCIAARRVSTMIGYLCGSHSVGCACMP